MTQDRKWKLEIPKPEYLEMMSDEVETGSVAAVSPMQGIVDKIFVKTGDKVKIKDPLVVVIAMKMEVRI